MIQSIKEIIDGLYSENKSVILQNAWSLESVFDSYAKIEENEFVTAMNRIIELCILEQDRNLLEQFLDILETGTVFQCSKLIDFEPLIKLFEKSENMDILWRLVIILGFSCQPQYIDYLNHIRTDDSVLLKEIKEAIWELEYINSHSEDISYN